MIDQLKLGETLKRLERQRLKINPGDICEYCEINQAEGFVSYSKAKVCLECYEDNHGI